MPDGYGNAQGRERESGSRRMAAVAVWGSVQEKTGGPKEAFPDVVFMDEFFPDAFCMGSFWRRFRESFFWGTFFRAGFPEQGFLARLLFRMNGLAPSRSRMDGLAAFPGNRPERGGASGLRRAAEKGRAWEAFRLAAPGAACMASFFPA